MESPIQAFEQLSAGAQVVVVILLAVQLTLATLALIRLARTDVPRVAGQAKPFWLLVIVLGQMLGPAVFLVLERRDRAARVDHTEHTAHTGEAAATGVDLDVVDRLYGPRR